jgi:hypothetical protein
MTSEWILDTVIGFQSIGFVPGITIPPGYDLTLAAYNATTDTAAVSPSLDAATSLDDFFWVPFSYCTTPPCKLYS